MEAVFVVVAIFVGLAAIIVTVVALLITRPRPSEAAQQGPGESAVAVADIMRSVDRSLDWVGGELGAFAGADVADLIVSKLESNPDVRIRILGGPRLMGYAGRGNATYDRWRQLRGKLGGRFEMRFSKGWPGQHFAIIDDEYLIVDAPHKAFEWPRTMRRYAKTYFASDRFARLFQRLWRQADDQTLPGIWPVGSSEPDVKTAAPPRTPDEHAQVADDAQ